MPLWTKIKGARPISFNKLLETTTIIPFEIVELLRPITQSMVRYFLPLQLLSSFGCPSLKLHNRFYHILFSAVLLRSFILIF